MVSLFYLVIYRAFIALIFRFEILHSAFQRTSMALIITFEFTLFAEVLKFLYKACLAYLC